MSKRSLLRYSELITIPTFEERLEYLRQNSFVGDITFGGSRHLNQVFYTSKEWRRFRRDMIIRDACNGDYCLDLAMQGFDIIDDKIIIHHLNPITKDDILERAYCLMNPENVVCTTHRTHNAIHYGNDMIVQTPTIVVRSPNDTCPWK